MVGKKSERSRLTTTPLPTCGMAQLSVERPLTKPCAGGLGRELLEDLVEHPGLRAREARLRGGEEALAAACASGSRSRRSAACRWPRRGSRASAAPATGMPMARATSAGVGEHGQAAASELLDVGAAVGEALGDADAEVDDVLALAPEDRPRRGARARSAASRFFSAFSRRARARGRPARRPACRPAPATAPPPCGRLVVAEPQVADAVDLGDLRSVEQAAEDEAAVDEGGALVALRRDGVDAADPRGAGRG